MSPVPCSTNFPMNLGIGLNFEQQLYLKMTTNIHTIFSYINNSLGSFTKLHQIHQNTS